MPVLCTAISGWKMKGWNIVLLERLLEKSRLTDSGNGKEAYGATPRAERAFAGVETPLQVSLGES